MRRGIRLGRVFGIDILIDPSWFFIGFLIAWSLSQLFAEFLSELSTTSHLVMGLLGGILFFSSVLGHELSHSLVARRKQIPVDSITLFIFGGVAKISAEPKTPGDEFKIAIAGPLSSVVFGGIFLGIGSVSESVGVRTGAVLFQVLGYVNLVLAIFNMLPGFPLDGGRVLRSIVWKVTGDVIRATRLASIAGRGVAALMVGYGLYQIVVHNEFIGGVWLILIALFLNQAAGSSYQQVVTRRRLEGLTVADLMTPDPKFIPGNITLDSALDDFFLSTKHSAFPVVGYADQVEGLLTLSMVRLTPREQWATTRVRQIMFPLREEITATAEESITSIMERIVNNPTGRFLVLDGEKLEGILTPTDIARRLRLHSIVGEPA